jgi:ABC-type iron transport system FetAB ATPase subunit
MALRGLFTQDPAALRQAVAYLENQPALNGASAAGEIYWAFGQFSYAQALSMLALIDNNPAHADRALTAIDSAQQFLTLDRAPALWRRVQHLRSTIYFSQSTWAADPMPKMRAAEAVLTELLANINEADEPEMWTVVTRSLELVRGAIARQQAAPTQ